MADKRNVSIPRSSVTGNFTKKVSSTAPKASKKASGRSR